MTKCPYCLRPFLNVNPAHLVKHGKRLEDVYGEFPGWDIGKTSKGATLGIKRSPEHKLKISLANKGRIFTYEHRKKISISRIGLPSPMKGKHHSKEAKRKLSKARRGQHNSPETEFKKNPNSFKAQNMKTYYSIHRWVRKNKGVPTICTMASTKDRCSPYFDWANINGEYEKDLDDYASVCRKHHFRYDREGEWYG